MDKIIQSIEPKIKAGYIQNVVALRFGYSIYNDPTIEKVEQFSGYDADCYYLVPSWIIECAYVDKPKKDYQSYHEPQIRMMTIDAGMRQIASCHRNSMEREKVHEHEAH